MSENISISHVELKTPHLHNCVAIFLAPARRIPVLGLGRDLGIRMNSIAGIDRMAMGCHSN